MSTALRERLKRYMDGPAVSSDLFQYTNNRDI
jgi:hypothetical protein